ncbi:N-6 DNA methylase, partial [Nitrosomonas sp.]|uniref:class I SAM-dependent DNA methyltransferase n=1 Tax=Nitrosomonas sp. TaxID=42353 RepID=UPI00273081B6
MLDSDTKRRIDSCRNMLVGRVPNPQSQVEQITIALIYKFMDDMDAEAEELGGKRSFFTGEFEQYGWSRLMAPGIGGFDMLSLYSEAIQKMNENPGVPALFRDIFKNAYLPYRDPETLRSFLKEINGFTYDHSERLGDAFEYLLSVLGSQGDAGQFRTPRHIIDFMVEIVDPKKNESILDPACGTAGFLISSYKHILKHNTTGYKEQSDREAYDEKGVPLEALTLDSPLRYKGDLLTPDDKKRLATNIRGYDISHDMVRLSLVNMYLHGFASPHIDEYDTLTSDEKWNELADVILANPPFMSPKGGIKPHKRFSVAATRSEVLFVDYIAEHLTSNGRAAVIVPEGIIFQSGNAYKQLREMLVKHYLVAVISLPAGVFNPYSGVKTSILVLDKRLSKKTDAILFAKIGNDGYNLGAQRRPVDNNDLPAAVRNIKGWLENVRNGTVFDVRHIANLSLVAKEKIGENGEWNLSADRYLVTTPSATHFPLVELDEVFCEIR